MQSLRLARRLSTSDTNRPHLYSFHTENHREREEFPQTISIMSITKFNQMSASKTSIVLVLFAFVLGTTLNQQLVSGEPDSSSPSGSADAGQNSGFGNPKRQYLIAPRIGRSASGSPAIWSAFEEAAPGQIQPQHGYPSPLRSSLLFLLGNRRMIGSRSGGLLPQARIGRRSAPIGLVPQPRVGRRSMVDSMGETTNDESDNQQEVAMATLSDSSPVNDILDSLMSVSADSAEPPVERSMVRATAFVPRLGKREQMTSFADDDVQVWMERILCASNRLHCNHLEAIAVPEYDSDHDAYLALIRNLMRGTSIQHGNVRFVPNNFPVQKQPIDLLDIISQQVEREPRAVEQTLSNLSDQGGAKRGAFTPRIG